MNFLLSKAYGRKEYIYYHFLSLFSLRILFEHIKAKINRLKVIPLFHDYPLQGVAQN
jgi:hypothetical protein